MNRFFAYVGIIILGLGIVAAIDALLAWVITWALNTFTTLHPNFLTVFVVLALIGILIGGASQAARRR